MENGIKRGDYVMLKPYMDRSKNPFADKLYEDNYGRNGLVRKVTYAPSQPWKVAEVIFSGVPYISVVPVIHLTFIGKREEWPLRTRCFPEPNMMVADYLTAGITTNFKRGLADLIKSSQNSLKGESTMKNTNNKPTPSNPIEQVIFNGPATIVYWKDGCKTVVKCQEDAANDHEKGLAMAVARHYFCDILGMSRYDGIFKKYLPKETKEK